MTALKGWEMKMREKGKKNINDSERVALNRRTKKRMSADHQCYIEQTRVHLSQW